eukprot:6018422-Prymnesium_polylepis.1
MARSLADTCLRCGLGVWATSSRLASARSAFCSRMVARNSAFSRRNSLLASLHFRRATCQPILSLSMSIANRVSPSERYSLSGSCGERRPMADREHGEDQTNGKEKERSTKDDNDEDVLVVELSGRETAKRSSKSRVISGGSKMVGSPKIV